MTHQDYVDALFEEDEKIRLVETVHFTTKHHTIYTVGRKKKYLTPFNDKKYFINPTSCLSFGHKNIRNLQSGNSRKRKKDMIEQETRNKTKTRKLE